MSYFNKVIIDTNNSTGDAFGRLRVSSPRTLFDSKQLNDNLPFFWDDAETSGSGTNSTYNNNQASTTISVGNLTAGTRVRQTFERFNYQPGKSQLATFTGIIGSGASGNTQRVGYFDENNGFFFECKDAVLKVVLRSKASGSVVDLAIPQNAWNLDKLDGTGPSGLTLDKTKTQIFLMDFEWLGVGRGRMGFDLNGITVYCHEFDNANFMDVVYMSTPNLPVRYEISNDGSGPAADLLHICSQISSEGGSEKTGIIRYVESNLVSSLSNSLNYAMLGIRLKSTHLDISVLIENISMIATSNNDRSRWSLIFNPTVAGTFTYNDEANSAVQIAKGSISNTVTGGVAIDGGYFVTAQPVKGIVENALRLGSKIDGTPDEIILATRPITASLAIEGSLTWRELL